MKNIFKLFTIAIASLAIASGCEKAEKLPFYDKGTAPVLSSNTSTLAPSAADSSSSVLTLSWTNPAYATDSNTVKYVVEIDAAGNEFANADTKIITGALTTSYTGSEINSLLLARGYLFDEPRNMEVRLISSYANNNEQYKSQVLTITMSAYKIPPKVQLPTSGKLFITGDATGGNWVNNPPLPSQELTRIDETNFGGIFYLIGGKNYIFLDNYGSWDSKYATDGSQTNSSGTFGFHDASNPDFNDNFSGPSADGWYRISLDFQFGTFKVEALTNPLPSQLFITGDATPSSWTNSPPSTQQFTGLNCCEFEISMDFVPGKYYKFLSTPGYWQPQFGGSSATGGTLGANYGSDGDPNAIPTPDVAGTYKVYVNFFTNTYSVTQ